MLAILEYYTSGFWIWLGITFGMAVVGVIVKDMAIGISRRR